jgi:hypothetical protein
MKGSCVTRLQVVEYLESGETDAIDIRFSEDFPENLGSSIVTSVVYVHSFGQLQPTGSFQDAVLRKYGQPNQSTSYWFWGTLEGNKPSLMKYPSLLYYSPASLRMEAGRIVGAQIRAKGEYIKQHTPSSTKPRF